MKYLHFYNRNWQLTHITDRQKIPHVYGSLATKYTELDL